MKRWIDTMLTGIFAGLILPMISFQAYVYLYRQGETVIAVLERFVLLNVLTHVISLACIPNLLLFFIFLWTGKERSAHGVIGATLIYAIIVAVLIFI